MILLIDNYDSFVYNLYQMVGVYDPHIQVFRNDQLCSDDIEALQPDAILLSPGPGKPKAAGVCEEVVRRFSGRLPLLGVCLGHQAICEAFGAQIGYAHTLMHGKRSCIHQSEENACPLFTDLPSDFLAARYHSLAVVEDSLPACLRVVARSEDGEVMAVQHEHDPTFGLQFHPESVMTPDGAHMLENFVHLAHNFKR